MRSAVIGLGDIAPTHLSAIEKNERIQLAAVCDIDETRRHIAPGAPFYLDYREMLEKEKLDCVHICLPHWLHYPVALDAAKAGCNIFAEKPLALNTAQALKFLELEREFGVRVCICFQNRRNPTTEFLLKELRSNKHGALTGIYGNVAWNRSKQYYSDKPWRGIFEKSGGGCMINQAIHTMDLMQYLAGSPIESIKGSISNILDYGLDVEDSAMASITFKSGAKGLFISSVANYEDLSVSINVECEKASFYINDGRLYRKGEQDLLLACDSVESAGKRYYGGSHAKLIAEFYEALERGEGDCITARDALVSIQMIDAVRESSSTGRRVLF
ncbi:MAG: Gfo/Idh/MocA family oxidoreductase [Clostridiales bacterium]|jgi:predicted dehydrogenase|nr:Gfo/Idh/MocA family oxidoreductase [Clostridiales bacterium]